MAVCFSCSIAISSQMLPCRGLGGVVPNPPKRLFAGERSKLSVNTSDSSNRRVPDSQRVEPRVRVASVQAIGGSEIVVTDLEIPRIHIDHDITTDILRFDLRSNHLVVYLPRPNAD